MLPLSFWKPPLIIEAFCLGVLMDESSHAYKNDFYFSMVQSMPWLID
ncbi:MAG: hypothetical protein RLZZ171_2430 [Cyanobacteriota bacterium]